MQKRSARIWDRLWRIDSVCSQPCAPHLRRKVKGLQSCCWDCVECAANELVVHSSCMQALENESWNLWANAVRNNCNFTMPEPPAPAPPPPGPAPPPPANATSASWLRADAREEEQWALLAYSANNRLDTMSVGDEELLQSPLSDWCEACVNLSSPDATRSFCVPFEDRTLGFKYWWVWLILCFSSLGACMCPVSPRLTRQPEPSPSPSPSAR